MARNDIVIIEATLLVNIDVAVTNILIVELSKVDQLVIILKEREVLIMERLDHKGL